MVCSVAAQRLLSLTSFHLLLLYRVKRSHVKSLQSKIESEQLLRAEATKKVALYRNMSRSYWERWRWELQKWKEEMSKKKMVPTLRHVDYFKLTRYTLLVCQIFLDQRRLSLGEVQLLLLKFSYTVVLKWL